MCRQAVPVVRHLPDNVNESLWGSLTRGAIRRLSISRRLLAFSSSLWYPTSRSRTRRGWLTAAASASRTRIKARISACQLVRSAANRSLHSQPCRPLAANEQTKGEVYLPLNVNHALGKARLLLEGGYSFLLCRNLLKQERDPGSVGVDQ